MSFWVGMERSVFIVKIICIGRDLSIISNGGKEGDLPLLTFPHDRHILGPNQVVPAPPHKHNAYACLASVDEKGWRDFVNSHVAI
jgi:hypothetical protein